MGCGAHFATDVAICITGVIIGVGHQLINGFGFGFLASCAGVGGDAFFTAGWLLCYGAFVPFVRGGAGLAADVAVFVTFMVIDMLAVFFYHFFFSVLTIVAAIGADAIF